MPKEQKFFWKRKRVSQKVYERRLQLVEIARNLRGSNEKFESKFATLPHLLSHGRLPLLTVIFNIS